MLKNAIVIPLTALLTLGLPLTGNSEGAVRVFDCESRQLCTGAGACQTTITALTLRMAPKTLSADGAGQYTMTFNNSGVTVEALSAAGPYLWTVADTRYTLLVSSNTELLLHTLTLTPAPTASVQFLMCSVQ
jgi:hypothetical protein